MTSRLQSANRSDLIQSGARFSSAAVRSARRRAAIAMGIVSPLLILSVGFTTVARAQQAPATSAAAAPPKAKATASHTAAPSHAATAKPAGLPVKSYGSSGAPIKLEVFTDYQCPSCRSFFEMTLRPLINDYVATGKVYLVHHDYPLSGHQYSGMAARWANAAARVGEFGNVEGALYDNQTAWEMTGDVRKYVAAAIPAADFQRVEQQMQGCDGPGPTAPPPGQTATISYPPGGRPCTLDTFIAADVAIGLKVPVQATPTYRITYKGQTLPAASGAVSWPILKQFFDSLLAQ